MTAGAPLLTFADAQAYLYGRFDFERTMVANPSRPFKLDRMLELSNRLGAPHQPIKAIHIAGTKGKGSTAVMTATVLTKAGYKTGLFTSPHLENLRQRFQINGELCSEEEFIQLVNQLIPVVTQMDLESENHPDRDLKPTFFELTTALAFLLLGRCVQLSHHPHHPHHARHHPFLTILIILIMLVIGLCMACRAARRLRCKDRSKRTHSNIDW